MERTALWTTALSALVFCGLLAGALTTGIAAQPTALDGDGGQQAVATAPSQTGDRPTIVATTEYRLTPRQAGRVEVHWQFEVPDAVGSVTTQPVDRAENLRTNGFVANGDGTYTWDKAEQSTQTPTMTFTVAVNRTRDVTGPVDAGGKYSFVDTGEWALFQRQVPWTIGYSYRGGSEPRIRYVNRTAGPGVAGPAMVFLGEYESSERTAHGQTFQLVVPDAATLTEEPSDIFASVTAASDRLRVGDRDERVLMIAAPQDVSWALRGLQTGERDFYVVANESVDSADNVWLHEYVHTRQNFETTEQSEWVIEASAEYYAGLLTLEQERIDFREFQAYLERGTYRSVDDVRLVAPSTWRGNGGNYLKGALVAGTLDRQLRAATDSRASLQSVFESLNRKTEASHPDVLAAVADAGGTNARDFARRYTETTATPSLWSRQTHEQVFGQVPAAFSYQFETNESNGLSVTGPYGERTATGGLVRNESLTVPIAVTNVGGQDGTYELTVTSNGESVATRSGQLRAGASTTESVTAQFTETGQYRLSTGDDSLTVTVRDPAALVVTDLASNRTSSGAETIRLTATVANQGDRPGEGTITISRGPTELASERHTLAAGETTTITATTTLDGPGTYEFSAGNARLTLTVEQTGGSDDATGGGTPGMSGPGFGVVATLVALVTSLLAHRIE